MPRVPTGRREGAAAPNEWLRAQHVQYLVAEVSKGADSYLCPEATERGRYRGTFVCRELVYAYATWVLAAFSLKVIRAFPSRLCLLR